MGFPEDVKRFFGEMENGIYEKPISQISPETF